MTKYTAGRKFENTPTVLVYGKDKKAPEVYDGDYTSDSLDKYVGSYCDSNGFGGPATEPVKEEK